MEEGKKQREREREGEGETERKRRQEEERVRDAGVFRVYVFRSYQPKGNL